MNARFCVVTALCLLAGCAKVRVEEPKDRFALGSQPQVYFIHHTAKKSFQKENKGDTAGGILFGPAVLIGTTLTRFNESARLQQRLDLEDPVLHAKDRLAQTLRRDLGLNMRVLPEASNLPILEATEVTADAPRYPTSPTTFTSLPERASGGETFRQKHPTGAVIEIVTEHWGMDDYRIKYYATATLTHLGESKVLMSTRCTWVHLDAFDRDKLRRETTEFDAYKSLAAYTERAEGLLYANSGALLKATLRKAGELCADRIAARFFGRGHAAKP